MYKLYHLLKRILALLKLWDRHKQHLHVRVAAWGQNQGNNDRDAQEIDEEEHVEACVTQESAQKDEVVGPCKDAVQDAHEPIEREEVEGAVYPEAQEAQGRKDYENEDLETGEGGVLEEEKDYDQDELHKCSVEIDMGVHSKISINHL